MITQSYKEALLDKAVELRQRKISKDQIAIERSAEIFDEIQKTADREMALFALNRDWTVATQVQLALERIADGTYGICAECEEPIVERRLNAIPWVSLCIRCQEQADREADAMDYPAAA
jgi:DnaK suppressor protein